MVVGGSPLGRFLRGQQRQNSLPGFVGEGDGLRQSDDPRHRGGRCVRGLSFPMLDVTPLRNRLVRTPKS